MSNISNQEQEDLAVIIGRNLSWNNNHYLNGLIAECDICSQQFFMASDIDLYVRKRLTSDIAAHFAEKHPEVVLNATKNTSLEKLTDDNLIQ